MQTFKEPYCKLNVVLNPQMSKDRSVQEKTTFYLRGTTFSGHPTRTTLGNTLRTILYTKFYLRDIGHQVVVAGDDCVVFCERADS